MVEDRLSPRFQLALGYALRAHSGDTRKGTGVPYFAHLAGVMSLVFEAGGDQEQAVAALLHDVVEGRGGPERLEEIRERFGERVARIVAGCTRGPGEGGDARDERRGRYVDSLPEKDEEVLLVSAADELHDARSTLRDVRRGGDDHLERFGAPREEVLDYYRGLRDAFRASPLEGWIVDELARTVDELLEVAGASEPAAGVSAETSEDE